MKFASTLLCLALGARAQFIDQRDRDLATTAAAKVVKNCGTDGANKMDLTSEERRKKKDDLLSAAGDNIILKAMTSAEDQKGMTTEMANLLTVGFLLPKAGPLVFGLFMIGVYAICCCWSACPCCKCCRCCKKERQFPVLCKLLFLAMLGALVLGVVVAGSLAQSGFNSAYDGLASTSCTAAEMVDSTMSGSTDPPFLGLIPTLQTFQALSESLDSNSDFISDLRTVLSDTKAISDAVVIASGTIGLLIDMMGEQANNEPKDTLGNSLLHTCTLCPELVKALTPAKEALDGSVGAALDGARSQVDAALSGDALTDLQNSMGAAAEPLIELKSIMHEAFGPFVEQDLVTTALSLMDVGGLWACLALIILGLIISGCGFLTLTCWVCVDKTKNPDESTRYRGHTHRCACCTWCSACYYTMFAFIVGGIMTLVCIPLSSLCLILEDVNGVMLNDISGAIGMDFTDPSGAMMIDMIDSCFRNPDPTANPLMLNLIKVDNNGTMTTMYDMVVGQTRDQINAEFDKISSSMDSGGAMPSLNNDPNIVALKSTLRNALIDTMMLPDESKDWQNDANYNGIAGSSLQDYFIASAACDDFTVPVGMPSAGKVVKGLDNFSAELANFGTRIDLAGCADKVTCNSGASVQDAAACASGNKWMDLKKSLRSVNTFKCMQFEKGGVPCDIKDMVETLVGSGVYTNDCLNANGALDKYTYPCDLATFTTLIQDFDVRLNLVFQRLDNSTGTVVNKIKVDMKLLVDTYVLDPITEVADGMTCGFLGKTYQGVIDGFCYGGVWGIKALSSSFIFCAVMTFFLIILMYIVWRISLDNYNSQYSTTIGLVKT